MQILYITATSLAVLWLRFRASNAGGASSNSDWGTKIKIPHAMRHNQKEKHSLKKKKKVVDYI